MTYCTTLTSVSCDCHSICFLTLVGLLHLFSITSVSVSVDSLTHFFFGLFGGLQTTVVYAGGQTTVLAGEQTLLALAGEQILLAGAQLLET